MVAIHNTVNERVLGAHPSVGEAPRGRVLPADAVQVRGEAEGLQPKGSLLNWFGYKLP